MSSDLEGDMVVLGVDLALLREAAGVLRLQQVDADPVVEQPDDIKLYIQIHKHRPCVYILILYSALQDY